MDLNYSTEMEAYRDEVKAFLSDNWPLRSDEAELPRREQATIFRQRAIDAGYLYRGIPRKYGGAEQEPDVLKAQIIGTEFALARAPREAPGIGTMMLVPTLLERGEEWMKEKFIHRTITGEFVWCQGYSEPGAGSDLASLKTKGELIGDEWVINGQKIWTSQAQIAHYMFCLVRTEPDAKKHAGISYLLLDMNQPGIDVRPLIQMTGSSRSDFNEVFLTDVRTPKHWIVGKRGEGWKVSHTTLKHERSSIGGANSRATLDQLVELAKRTRIDGKPAIEDPGIRQRIATLDGFSSAHQYTSFRQFTANAKGENAGIVNMMMKLFASDFAQEAGKLALDLLQDDGLLAAGDSEISLGKPRGDSPSWISQYMNSLGIAIAGGTSNIQRNVIAERGLGLPRDAAAERSSAR